MDPEVVVSSENLTIGDFYNVKITGAEDYDLLGEVVPTMQLVK